MKETRAAAAKIKSLLCEDLHVCLLLSRPGSTAVSGTTHTGRGVKDEHQPVHNWDLALHREGKKIADSS